MRHIFTLFAAALVIASCGESMERKAQLLVDEAAVAYESQDYSKAKLLLDSVKKTYRKAFKVRRQALKLQRDVELAEQSRSLEYFDAQIAGLCAVRDALIPQFILDKDSRYQDVGNYVIPSQEIKNNVGVSYLRATVDEKGVAKLSSFYRGKAIRHTTVRVNCGEEYAECAEPASKHTSKHLGATSERLDFIYGKDGGLMDFIATANGKITVQLSGGTNHSYVLRSEDAAAVKKILELAQAIQAIEQMKDARAEAERHINFLIRSKEKYDVKENEEQ